MGAQGSTTPEPLVSVVIPVFDARQYLDEALTSIREQSLRDIEIICVDDGSTDGSLEALRVHAEQDERVRVLAHDENRGPGAARNLGIERARGRYLYFFDSDDRLEADALRRLVDRAESQALDAVFFNAYPSLDPSIDPALQERYEQQYRRTNAYEAGISGPELVRRMTANGEWKPSPCLYVCRRGLVASRGLTFSEGLLHEDNGFTMRLMLAAERVGYDESAYFARRVRSGSIMTREVSSAHLRGLVAAVAELLLAPAVVLGPADIAADLAAAVELQAELLFQDAVRKYRLLPEEEREALRNWSPRAPEEVFILRRLLAEADRLGGNAALERRVEELRAENEAYRNSRVLRAVRRVRAVFSRNS